MTKNIEAIRSLNVVIAFATALAASTPAYADTKTLRVSARDPSWQNTGIKVKTGDTISFAASGTIVYWKSRDGKQKETCGPDGLDGPTQEGAYLAPGFRKMGLVGMIGNHAFDVGSKTTYSVLSDGVLLLGINDTNKAGGCADNEGNWTVTITTSQSKTPAAQTQQEGELGADVMDAMIQIDTDILCARLPQLPRQPPASTKDQQVLSAYKNAQMLRSYFLGRLETKLRRLSQAGRIEELERGRSQQNARLVQQRDQHVSVTDVPKVDLQSAFDPEIRTARRLYSKYSAAANDLEALWRAYNGTILQSMTEQQSADAAEKDYRTFTDGLNGMKDNAVARLGGMDLNEARLKDFASTFLVPLNEDAKRESKLPPTPLGAAVVGLKMFSQAMLTYAERVPRTPPQNEASIERGIRQFLADLERTLARERNDILCQEVFLDNGTLSFMVLDLTFDCVGLVKEGQLVIGEPDSQWKPEFEEVIVAAVSDDRGIAVFWETPSNIVWAPGTPRAGAHVRRCDLCLLQRSQGKWVIAFPQVVAVK